MDKLPATIRGTLAARLPLLQIAALMLMFIALARPQAVERQAAVPAEAADLMVALDISTSMLAVDNSHPSGENRLDAARTVLARFLERRPGDRVGLIVFAGHPYSAAPLTFDHAWLRQAALRVKIGTIEDGTALGEALLAALARLRGGTAKSRAVILLTDGRSNSGIPPRTAAEAAAALGVRVYTIGAGSDGTALFPVENPLGGVMYRRLAADLDEATLADIAGISGGRYFRARDHAELETVFREIDRLERAPVTRSGAESYRELAPFVLTAALAALMAGFTLSRTVFRGVRP